MSSGKRSNTFSFDDNFVLVLTSPPKLSVQVLDETQERSEPLDIKIQGETRATGVDVLKQAGGPRKAVTLKYQVEVKDNLRVELIPSAENPNLEQLPVVTAVEVQRQP